MNFYLNRFGFQGPKIADQPNQDLGIIVVIPCYNEPEILPTLESLDSCNLAKYSVEVIVVINRSISNDNQVVINNNTSRLNDVKEFRFKDPSKTLFSIDVQDLPHKHAGVGLARKIGMDEAVYRFDQIDKDGIIVCFDSDSKCDTNYLSEIEKHFENNPKSPGCSIHYEHPVSGDDFEESVYAGIIQYELHLRYYEEASRFCNLPYAFQTVGSSMAVRSSAYQKQGGMNKRKAGEDFYFLHKIIALGDFTELNTTRVIPSPRSSDRVPFGTGRAIQQWQDSNSSEYLTYAFSSFEEIKRLVDALPEIYEGTTPSLDQTLKNYLDSVGFEDALQETKSNTKDYTSFHKRFFRWFDAFKLLKCLHYMRDQGFHNSAVQLETERLLKALNYQDFPQTPLESLKHLRSLKTGGK